MPFQNELTTTFLKDDPDQAVLHEDLVYEHPEFGVVVVAAGFRTDFASVPGYVLMPGIVPKVGRVRAASVVHDWIYRGHEGARFTRAQADRILLDAAIECGMARWRAWIAYVGVRIGGGASWYGNK
jgi:hypothetical protein